MNAPAPSPARVRGNDWHAVPVPPLSALGPSRGVSVVIPCYGHARELGPVLLHGP